jgi:hypothetical protein
MTITRGIAAAALFAGVFAGTASTAWADPPTMSGHYTVTSTDSTGRSTSGDWYFTSCGGGCASRAFTPGGPADQARLVNGQWTMDDDSVTTVCSDGSKVPHASTGHYTWDPNTLAGTAQFTDKFATCGDSAPRSWTNNIQLRQAGEGSSPNHAPEK